MSQFKTPWMLAAVAFAVGACNNASGDKDPTKGSATPAAAAAPKAGCDGLYVDPKKEFCLKLPAGFEVGDVKAGKPGDLTQETVNFKGPSDTFAVNLGLQSSAHKTFEDDLAGEDKSFTDKPGSVLSSGATSSTGKWWVYKGFQDKPAVEACVRSKADKTLLCEGATPAAIEACKSLRVYPQ
jgi:hypothetical protein